MAVPQEALDMHVKMTTDLDNHIGQSIDKDQYEQLKNRLKSELTPKDLVSGANSIMDILNCLERKGKVKPGKYDILKKIVSEFDVRIVDNVIEPAEKAIKGIISKHQRSLVSSSSELDTGEATGFTNETGMIIDLSTSTSKSSTQPPEKKRKLEKVPEIENKSTITSNGDETNFIEPEGQLPSTNTVGRGDKQDVEKEKSLLAEEKTQKDIDMSKTEREATADKQKITDLDKKPYLFSQGAPEETEFIDTKSKPSDLTSNSEDVKKTEADPPNLSTQDKDNNHNTDKKPIPKTTEVQEKKPVNTDKEVSHHKEDSTGKEVPDEDSGGGKTENQQQQDEKGTGYNKSQFSEPGDEQDENISKQHKSSGNSEKSKKKKQKKKSKDFFWPEPPPNAQNVQYYGNVENVFTGNKIVKMTANNKTEANIEPTFVITQKEIEMLKEVFDSVGYIHGESETGTCWRVGENKIITAFHVVRNNIWNNMLDSMQEKKLSQISVDFGYIDKKNDLSTSDNVFKVEPKVVYSNESLDVAILQLKKDDKKPFPKPLRNFRGLDPKSDRDKKIFLISHDKGKEKGINGNIGIWTPTEKRLKDLEKFCQKNGWENGYTELDKPERLVLKCEFVGGASGSPGIIIQGGMPYVVLLYIRGFPDFYYSQQFSSEKKRTFPSDKLLQQGVGIRSIFKDMTSKTFYLDLRDKIFPEEAKAEREQMFEKPHHEYAMGGYNIENTEISQEDRNNAKQNEQSVPAADNRSHETIRTQTCTDDNDGQNNQDTTTHSRQTSQVLQSGKDVNDYQSQILLSGKRQNLNLSHYAGSDGSSHSNPVNSTGDVTDIPAIHQNRTTATPPDQAPVIRGEAVSGESNQLCRQNQGNTQPVPNVTVDEWVGADFQVHKDKQLNKDLNLHKISKAVTPNAVCGFGLLLGYQTVDIDMVKMNHPADPIFHLLVKWRNKTGHAATLDKIVHVLHNLSETDMGSVNINYLKDAISNFQD